ncbi:MAG TPA: S8 family peptidase [Oligoflexia bacterium]|nr:S8 family peptidase [Oligoflexia bacterium]HMR24008.1 S8 family peptidase [Oligoflexia bacterium]
MKQVVKILNRLTLLLFIMQLFACANEPLQTEQGLTPPNNQYQNLSASQSCQNGEIMFLPKKNSNFMNNASIHQLTSRNSISIKKLSKDPKISSKNENSLHPFKRIQRLEITDVTVDEAAILNDLKNNPDIEFAEMNCNQYVPTANTNDPLLPSLWGMDFINAPEAWDTEQGENVVVAVIDTGVMTNHVDLSNNIWSNPNEIANNGIDDDNNGCVDDVTGCNFVNNAANGNISDSNGHGTHVSGTIAATGNNSTGVVGVAYKAKIMGIKVLGSQGGIDSWIANGIEYAADQGAQVINMSLGCNQACPPSQVTCSAIDYAKSQGTVVIVAAGNSNANAANYSPANCGTLPNTDGGIVVASHTSSGSKSGFSNFGNIIDVSAPGSEILSTWNNNSYNSISGTSMAAPHVAGVAALTFGKNPFLTVSQVEDILRDSATDLGTPGYDTSFGHGGVNAFEALNLTPETDADPPSLEIGGATLLAGNVIEVLVNTQLNFVVSDASDDQVPVTFSATGLPSAASFETDTGVFSWTPSVLDLGDHPVSFMATSIVGSDQIDVIIRVVEEVIAPTPPGEIVYEPFISSAVSGCGSNSHNATLIMLILVSALILFQKSARRKQSV